MAKHSLVCAPFNAAAGSSAVVAADTRGRIIYVVAFAIVAGTLAGPVDFRSAAAVIAGPFALAVNGGVAITAPGDDSWLFKTLPGEALNVNNGGTTTSGGFVTYYLG